MSGGGHGSGRLESAKVATSLVFALNGWTFATWAGRIPTLREDLGLSPGQLGLVMLVGSAGSLLGLPFAGRLVGRFGAAWAVRTGAALSLSSLMGVGFTAGVLHSVPVTAVPLFLSMLGIGIWDVSMNIEGAAVEHHLGRTIMPRYHAAFSLGTVFSALLSSGLTAAGVPIVVHFWVVSPLIFFAVAWCVRAFLPRAQEADEAGVGQVGGVSPAVDPPAGGSAWCEPRTLLIGVVTMVAAFTEGAANDWLSVAFIDGYRLPQWAGVLGFAVFLGFMTAGRWFGAPLLDRYGRVPVLRALFVLAGVGSLLVVFGTASWAYLGAAVWGVGVSLGFPVGMSAAADDPGRAAARMSVVSTVAYGAFLMGPPGLGWLGDHVGVLRSLGVVSALLLCALVALPVVGERPRGVSGRGGGEPGV
ncbi:Fucose permease [Austwickia chelonae]|nr:MFS transporter [Austwickia chelonae]SEW43731.1 Fucose permease [Austwickia chelonae]